MTQSDELRIPASSAAEYLVKQMDDDGAWRKNLSEFCDSPADTNAFNIRSAWALMRASRIFDIAEYKNAALANLNFVVGLSNDNGWIDKNCLNRPDQPLLHTIAYAYQGLLECSVLEQHEAALDVVLNGNQALFRNFERHGQLYGRYADCWTPTVRWRCLTGEAQTAIVWQRLGVVTGDGKWQKAARQLNTQLKRTQSLHGKPGVAGGIKGSQPVTAPYGRLEFLNWAAKFFADALMLELGVTESSVTG